MNVFGNYGLKPGEELQHIEGMQTYGELLKIFVIEEFPRHILCDLYFINNYGEHVSHVRCVNKASLYCGAIKLIRVKTGKYLGWNNEELKHKYKRKSGWHKW